MTQLRLALLLLVFASAVTLPGCRREVGEEGPRYGAKPVATAPKASYHLAVPPLYNPSGLAQVYRPLVDHLSREMEGTSFDLDASRDYPHFTAKIRDRLPAFLIANPLQAILAMDHGYRVLAMAGEPGDSRGIFLVREDSGLRDPADLKGKVVSYADPTAMAGCMLPQHFLFRQGVNVMTELDNRYVGSQESVIRGVILGRCMAGAVSLTMWRAFQRLHQKEAALVQGIWETEPLLPHALLARDDVPPPVVDRVRALFLGLHDSQQGRETLAGLAIPRFLPASNIDYAPVQTFIARFEQDVRAVR